MDAAEVGAAAARAAREAGVVDRLQAAALAQLAMSDDVESVGAARRTLAGDLSEATRALAGRAEAVAQRLEDADAGAALLDELGAELSHLLGETRRLAEHLHDPSRPSPPAALYAPEEYRTGLEVVLRALRRASDLLDDGEPADTAAFEVLAARDQLLRLL